MANRTEFAILGLLADGPRSGYDIRREVQEKLSHFWNESVGHIYPMLRRLHGKGLVSRTTESTPGRPDRHVYSITEDGLAELQRWLAEPIEPAPPRLEILLKICFGSHTAPDVLIDHVVKYKRAREQTLALLEGIHSALDSRADRNAYLRLTLSAGIHAARAAVAWGDEALATLRAIAAAESRVGGRPTLH